MEIKAEGDKTPSLVNKLFQTLMIQKYFYV